VHCESVADVQLTSSAQCATPVQSVHTRSFEPLHACVSKLPLEQAPVHALHCVSAVFVQAATRKLSAPQVWHAVQVAPLPK